MSSIAYFDNAATTYPKPEIVYTFMDSIHRELGVNVGRGQHKLAAKASALVEETRWLLLELNHCTNKRVVFTPSATLALNAILRGISLDYNANVYVSPFEHNAVTRVLHFLSKIHRINIHILKCNKNSYEYQVHEIKKQFEATKPDLVVMSHASNVCGVIAPIFDICALSKHYGALNVIDMCQTMGLLDTNISNENIDYCIFAAHKALYGSLGLGGFISKECIQLEPFLYGGTGIDSANQSMPDNTPERFEVGSPNIVAIAGLNASLRWIKEKGIKTVYKNEHSNHCRLLSLLHEYDNIKVLSPMSSEKSVGVVSCVFDGYGSDSIGHILSNNDIAVRTGLQCSPLAHRFIGTFPAGTVRFSVGFFNDDNDFVKLDKALKYVHDNS